MPTREEKRLRFRLLHESGCFVLPNPWDVGSARYLQGLGFKALASTSSGTAWSLGRPDNSITLEMALAHLRTLVAATDLPVNADFESGFAPDPADVDGVARNVARCLETGVAALSIEDSTGDPARPLHDLPAALDRLRAARQAIDDEGGADARALLVGRAECYLVGHPDPLAESIRRLRAYAEAGADVLYAPGVTETGDIATLVAAVAPKPLNVLALPRLRLDVTGLARLGVRRVSLGGGLARIAWGAFLDAARHLAEAGTFDALAAAPSGAELNRFFRAAAEAADTEH